MGIPGYDPSDLDDHLEEQLARQDRSKWLSEADLAAYERGDATLVDLLTGEEIAEILDIDEVDPQH